MPTALMENLLDDGRNKLKMKMKNKGKGKAKGANGDGWGLDVADFAADEPDA